MILCIDLGNSHFFGGVFDGEALLLRFRLLSKNSTSDEIGIFLKAVLRENNISPESIEQIAMCSVVPNLDYSLRAACLKYFSLEPFVVQAGVKTGLKINYQNPLDVGADRIANSIAAMNAYPNKNLIVIDFGTAITFCAVDSLKTYRGGVILAGLRLSMEALQANTAKLPTVEIIRPKQCLGRNTIDSIQSGLYFSVLGGCKEILKRLKAELFPNQSVLVIGTGGFASLYESEEIFDVNHQDLVLHGLNLALKLNH